MRFPCEYYIRYLLLSLTVAEVKEQVELLGYPAPNENYLKRLNRETKKVNKSTGKEMRKWARDNRVYSMLAQTKDSVEARQLTVDPNFRSVMETLLMSGLPSDKIAENFSVLSGNPLDSSVVELYEHYFWNRKIMAQDDWEKFLRRYPNGQDLYRCWLSPPAVALWKVGISPRLDEKHIVDKILGDSFMRWEETNSMKNSKDTAITAELWSKVMFKALDERRQGGDALSRILMNMHEATLRLRSMNVPDARLLLEENNKVIDLVDLNEQEYEHVDVD